MTTTIETVRSALTDAGASHLTRYAGPLSDHLNRSGVSRSSVEGFVRSQGASPSAYSTSIDSFIRALGQEESVATPEAAGNPGAVEGFDKAIACAVIREFITEGSTHGGAYDDEEVTALLVLAGLEDEPEPEPEPEPEAPFLDEAAEGGALARIEQALAKLTSTVSGLVDFAKGHGYRG